MKKIEVKKNGTINKKYVAAIGTESKDKFSLFGKIVKDAKQSEGLGPGSYDTHAIHGVASKKGYNTTL